MEQGEHDEREREREGKKERGTTQPFSVQDP